MRRRRRETGRTNPPFPRDSELPGFVPVAPPVCRGWTAKKTAIRDRLAAARAEGTTYAELEATGKITFAEASAILSAAKMGMESYRRAEAALDALGK